MRGCWSCAATSAAAGSRAPARRRRCSIPRPRSRSRSASSEGVDLGAALDYARTTGGPALRALTFAERGALLKAIADAIQARARRAARPRHRERRQHALRRQVRRRRRDRHAARLRRARHARSATRRFLVDGEGIQLGRSARFHGQHICGAAPRRRGAHQRVQLPGLGLRREGGGRAARRHAGDHQAGHQLGAGRAPHHGDRRRDEAPARGRAVAPRRRAGDLLEHLGAQDVLAFTGSGDTGARIRALPNVIRDSVRVNVEADSLNAAVLGPDVEPRSDMYELFLKDVVRDMTQKAGQKCTAIRRVLVPQRIVDVGDERPGRAARRDPRRRSRATRTTRMGPLATAAQLADVREGVARLGGRHRVRQRCAPARVARASSSRRCWSRTPARRGARARGLRPGRDAAALHGRTPARDRGARRRRPGVLALLRRPGVHRADGRASSRRTTAASSSAIRRSSSRPARARCCRSWSTAARGAPAAARSSAACAASRSTCSASRSRAAAGDRRS